MSYRFIASFIIAFWNVSAYGTVSISCDDFMDLLRDQIHRNGNKVARPEFKIKSQSGTVTDYSIFGIRGVEGELSCTSDVHRLEVRAMHDDEVGSEENALRVLRAGALAAAGLCVLDPIQEGKCKVNTDKLFDIAIDEFKASRRRGDLWPKGTAQKLYKLQTEISYDTPDWAKATEITLTILVNGEMDFVVIP